MAPATAKPLTMITVTFNFTDIAAAAALFGKLSGTELGAATVSTPAPAPVEPAAKAEAPGKPSKKSAAAPEPVAAPAPATAPPVEAPAPAAASAPEITYPDLQKAVLTLHKLDPTAAVPIARSLGADTFKALAPGQWAEAHRLVTEAIAARG